jgi:hypothetical protein
VGAGSVFCTPVAGRRTDRHGPDRVTLVCLVGAIAAAATFVAGRLVAGGV